MSGEGVVGRGGGGALLSEYVVGPRGGELPGKSLEKWMEFTSGGSLSQGLGFIWSPCLSPVGFWGLLLAPFLLTGSR